MKVTVEMLKKMGACGWKDEAEQVGLFKRTFPSGAEITRENLETARDAGLDLDWFARMAFIGIYADYEAKRAAIDADYNARRVEIAADYAAKRAPIDADYEAKSAPIDADYNAKRAAIAA